MGVGAEATRDEFTVSVSRRARALIGNHLGGNAYVFTCGLGPAWDELVIEDAALEGRQFTRFSFGDVDVHVERAIVDWHSDQVLRIGRRPFGRLVAHWSHRHGWLDLVANLSWP